MKKHLHAELNFTPTIKRLALGETQIDLLHGLALENFAYFRDAVIRVEGDGYDGFGAADLFTRLQNSSTFLELDPTDARVFLELLFEFRGQATGFLTDTFPLTQEQADKDFDAFTGKLAAFIRDSQEQPAKGAAK